MSYRGLISVDQQVKHQFVSVRLWPKMTSIVDSEAHLAKRGTEVGLTNGALQSLVPLVDLLSLMVNQEHRLMPLHSIPSPRTCWAL